MVYGLRVAVDLVKDLCEKVVYNSEGRKNDRFFCDMIGYLFDKHCIYMQ